MTWYPKGLKERTSHGFGRVCRPKVKAPPWTQTMYGLATESDDDEADDDDTGTDVEGKTRRGRSTPCLVA